MAKLELKSLDEQVIVVTGATSGIGLATARLAAERGAHVVLTSRSERHLKRAAREIRASGGVASWHPGDVGNLDDMHAVAEHARRELGGFDSWVNNAGITMFGPLTDVSLEDARRLFETNYWGVVNGSLVAADRLKARGGSIINVGSVLSDRAIGLQGHYSASKHAVKGFTDALRMELERAGEPISVTLVKPSSTDTPYVRNARNLMRQRPSLPPPVYSPRTVARAILHCAAKPTREITVGGGRGLTVLGKLAPRLADRYMEAVMMDQQKKDERAPLIRRDGLHRPRRGGVEELGEYEGHVLRTSASTQAAMHPLGAALAVAVLGAGVALALRGDRDQETHGAP